MQNKNFNFDVSIVIISWNMEVLLKKCLNSVYKHTKDVKFEIILIDNHSTDNTLKMINECFPNVNLIKNKKNMGVAPARNQGLKVAKGKYILILDADVELVENSILKMFNFMEKQEDCGVVGCKLLDTNLNLQYTCKRFPTLIALISRRLDHLNIIKNSKFLRNHIMADWDHNSTMTVDYIIGACQFFRSSLLESVGYYDDKIFYGPEDIDFCLRVWKSGWKIYYYPHTNIIHHEQRITKKKIFSKISFKHFLGILYLFNKYKGKIKI